MLDYTVNTMYKKVGFKPTNFERKIKKLRKIKIKDFMLTLLPIFNKEVVFKLRSCLSDLMVAPA